MNKANISLVDCCSACLLMLRDNKSDNFYLHYMPALVNCWYIMASYKSFIILLHIIDKQIYFQVAHMTRSELQLLDTSLLGPLLLFLNQYFNSFINEYFLLWVCMVSCMHRWKLCSVFFFVLCLFFETYKILCEKLSECIFLLLRYIFF